MQEIISKELLSAVLNIKGNFRYGFVDISIPELDKVEFNKHTNNVIMALKPNPLYGTIAPVIRTNSINVHELTHLCKEWGVAQQLKHNFHISVATHKGTEYSATIAYWSDQLKNESFRASSEPEVVFKACQWILDNKDK